MVIYIVASFLSQISSSCQGQLEGGVLLVTADLDPIKISE